MRTKAGATGTALVGVLIALLGIACAGRAAAQSVESDSVKEKLSGKVHLQLGTTTLGKIARALSEQTGLKIEPMEYLQDREMIAQIDGLSARAVLNALSELNDWKWKETPEHIISIGRNLLHPPAVPGAIPRIVQSAIPKDTRAFLQIHTPSENLDLYINPLLADMSPLHQGASSLRNIRAQKVARFLMDTQGELLSSLPADAPKGIPIPFAKLTDVQQRNLIAQIAFKQLALLDEYLLSDLPPYIVNPASASLEIKGATLRVGIHMTPDSWAGFQANINQ